MAIEVSINDLKNWLSQQPQNTEDTPYEITVTDLTVDNYRMSITSSKFVDFRTTVLPEGITNLCEDDVYVDGETKYYKEQWFANNECTVYPPQMPSTLVNMRLAFSRSPNLKEAPIIPDSVKHLGYAFYNCYSLSVVPNLPEGIVSMEHTFENCRSLVLVPPLPSTLDDDSGYYEHADVLGHTFSGCFSLNCQLTIPEGIKHLDYTFMNCKSLVTPPVIESSVLSDLGDTFVDCTSLTEMPVLPPSVEELYMTFRGCTSLKETTELPDGIENLYYAFSECTSLEKVVNIPASVRGAQSAFENCTSLKIVKNCYAVPIPNDNFRQMFTGTNPELVIYVPDENLDTWKNSEYIGIDPDKTVKEFPVYKLITLANLKEYDVARNNKLIEKLAKKVDKGEQTTGDYVYTREDGVEGQKLFGSAPGASTIMSRDSNGRTKVADIDSTSGGTYAANKNFVDNSIKKVTDTIGQPNGIASLDANGHVPVEQMPTEALIYKGQWDASTGSYPEDGTTIGDFYIVSIEGNVGTVHFFEGDWIIWDGTKWSRSANANAVVSINGKQGVVELNYGDVGALPDTYVAPVTSVNGQTGDVTVTEIDDESTSITETWSSNKINTEVETKSTVYNNGVKVSGLNFVLDGTTLYITTVD